MEAAFCAKSSTDEEALFSNTNALCSQLILTHYCLLLRIEDDNDRNWYMKEYSCSVWSSQQLEQRTSTAKENGLEALW